MALEKKFSFLKSKCGNMNAREELGLGFVKYTRGLGRKRIVLLNDTEVWPIDSSLKTPSKKRSSERLIVDSEKFAIEALPQEILIRILCAVNHDDLKQLFHVSKTIREATLNAKQCHFAYTTPSKTRAFRNAIDYENPSDFDEIEGPNAPKQLNPYRSRICRKNLADISVALFNDTEI